METANASIIQTEEEYQERDAIAMSSLRNDSNVPFYRRKYFKYAVIAVLLLVVILAISIPVSQNNKEAATESESTSSTEPVYVPPEVSTTEHETNKEDFGSTLLTYYTTYGLDWEVAMEEQSPQSLALEWVAGQKDFYELDRPRKVQRYVLAVLYYSTYNVQNDYWNAANGDAPVGWTSSQNWISSESECDWEGVTCEGEAVVGILLREHNLSGYLPLELAFLSTSLITLDFTSNFIYMDGDATHTPLSHLAIVETLLLEDNYIYATNGLPNGLSEMSALEKVSLSYNLLQGSFSGAFFSKLAQLTHLEVESNFLVGTLPSELLSLPEMIYVYLRNNYLDLPLPTVFGSGTWPSLFAVWLDSNNVTGPIPPSIAEKLDLASFSITNTTLAGPIPSEIGMLSGMRRLWLYENALTGTIPTELASLSKLEVFEVYGNPGMSGSMPLGVCTIIANAAYEFKALTTTCSAVTCDNCCTECY